MRFPSPLPQRNPRATIRSLLSVAGGIAVFLLGGASVHGRRADSFEFLTLPVGARSVALGGAGVADADGWAGSQINPASLGRLWRDEIGFTGTRWMDDVQYQAVGGAHPFLGGGAMAVTLLSIDYGSIPSFTTGRAADGTVSGGGRAVKLG